MNGSASMDTSALPKGSLILAVEYPTQNVDGVGEVVGDTDELRYEVE